MTTQPKCGNIRPHKPHNGFATHSDKPWCEGVSEDKPPNNKTFDEVIKAAFAAGYKRGSVDVLAFVALPRVPSSWQLSFKERCEERFKQWLNTRLP